MTSAVYAAGAVCWRVVDGKVHILVIHRTVHGDVTIPKGKVDPGESLPQTAVREVKEESGLDIALGVPLGISSYTMPNGREKIVHYWAGEVHDEAVLRSSFVPNGEVAALEWVSIKRARGYLSYEQDVEILNNFARLVDEGVLSTFSITVMRHGKATPRGNWDGPDHTRPLLPRGVQQANAAVETLRAWRPKRIISSTATRCYTTVAPLSAASGIEVKRTDLISQDSWEEGTSDVRGVIGKRIRSRKSAVICSHGPLLLVILREIALATGTITSPMTLADAASLEPGAFSIAHLSRDNPSSGVIAIETHSARA